MKILYHTFVFFGLVWFPTMQIHHLAESLL